MNNYPRMTALARTFPTFAREGRKGDQPGIEPFDALLLEKGIGGMSHGEKCTAYFLLSVFNWENPFDMHEALGVWDADHHEAFVGWVKAPWWA